MIPARLIWAPAPYLAGFSITDDPDTATTEQVRAVYDVLLSHGCPTTKAVWPFPPTEHCGIPALPDAVRLGMTLEDDGHAALCRSLRDRGAEICLHGASGGNNRRERTLAALDLMRRDFPGSHIYICHSKNADNPYWGDKVSARTPLRALARLNKSYRSEGDTEESPYFWGDACRREGFLIRLYRTRRMNTLAFNPSMPYADPAKPYVTGWFSATKRYFVDCTTREALDRLKREAGLTILYQYLYRYADPVTFEPDPAFVEGVRRLGDDPEILVAPVSAIMQRLRLMQGVFLVSDGGSLWALNINEIPVEGVQVRIGQGARASRIVLNSIPAGACLAVPSTATLTPKGLNAITMPGRGRASHDFGARTLQITRAPAGAAARFVWTWFPDAPADSDPYRTLSVKEEVRLFFGQLAIIARELLLGHRQLRDTRWLRGGASALDDHRTW